MTEVVSGIPPSPPALGSEARIGLYNLLSRLLSAPPSEAELQLVARLRGDASRLGQEIDGLAAAAGAESQECAQEAFQRLFIGLGGGEFIPYASHHLAGSLHDLPLARLRGDLRRLGLRRSADVREPEDHAATVLEIMAALLGAGNDRDAAPFFAQHIAPWLPRFLGELMAVRDAPLYAALGATGAAFLAGECERWGARDHASGSV